MVEGAIRDRRRGPLFDPDPFASAAAIAIDGVERRISDGRFAASG
jgi:hypothetical protein